MALHDDVMQEPVMQGPWSMVQGPWLRLIVHVHRVPRCHSLQSELHTDGLSSMISFSLCMQAYKHSPLDVSVRRASGTAQPIYTPMHFSRSSCEMLNKLAVRTGPKRACSLANLHVRSNWLSCYLRTVNIQSCARKPTAVCRLRSPA